AGLRARARAPRSLERRRAPRTVRAARLLGAEGARQQRGTAHLSDAVGHIRPRARPRGAGGLPPLDRRHRLARAARDAEAANGRSRPSGWRAVRVRSAGGAAVLRAVRLEADRSAIDAENRREAGTPADAAADARPAAGISRRAGLTSVGGGLSPVPLVRHPRSQRNVVA